MTKSHHPRAPHRDDYAKFQTITLRWHDNDLYGHVNNVVYYQFFDTIVNQVLMEAGLLDVEKSKIVGFVVGTSCNFFSSLAYPGKIEIGMAVAHLGRSSARYRLAVFGEGAERASAAGEFTQVYIERGVQRPVDIPADVRAFLETLQK